MKSIKKFFVLAFFVVVSMIALIGCTVELSEKKITIDMKQHLHVGDTIEVNVELKEGDLDNIVLTIDNTDVAEIVDGVLYALKAGEFNLTAEYGSIRDIKHFFVLEYNVYAIDYELNGGQEKAGTPLLRIYREDEGAVLLEEPVRDGYAFAGFYENEDFSGEEVTFVYGPEGKDMVLYAKWEVVNYRVSYQLNGGEVEGLVDSYNIESQSIELPQPEKEHYDFLGWELEGEEGYVTSINPQWLKNVSLVAVFEAHQYPISFELNEGSAEGIELPEGRTLNDSIELPSPERTNHEFLGWFDNVDLEGEAITTLDASNLDIEVLYAKWASLEFAFIGENAYPTIAAALEAAQDGDVIKLVAHEFTEAVNITKAVKIEGPNAGVKGYEERQEEAVLKGTVTVAAEGVVLDGLRFEEDGYIIVSANNVTIQNIYSIAKTTKVGSSNRYAQIVASIESASATIKGLSVLDSYLNSGSNGNQKGCIAAESNIGDVLIKGNHLENDVTSTSAICEAIEFYNLGTGKIEIVENEIRFNTDNFIIFMGNYANNASEVVIKDNILAGSEAAETKHTAGVAVRYLPANASYTFEHNYVYNMYGNLLDARYGKAGATMDVLYNYFELPFKFTNKADVTISYEGNAYESAQTHATPDVQEFSVYGIPELEAAYNLYKNAIAQVNGQRFLTLAEALAAAQDGDTILVAAGNHDLGSTFTISKNVTIQGKSMDETVFFTGTSSIHIGASVTIKDMTFETTRANNGNLFYSAAGMGDVVFENVRASVYNSFFRANAAAGNSLKMVGCEFDHIGQFLVWNYTASTVQTVEFISGKIDLASCGIVENTAASLFRMRAGSLYVYDSFFEGNLPSTTGGLFENGNEAGEVIIAFNTFKNATKLDRNYNENYKVQFNKNLYLDADGNVLEGMAAAEIKSSTLVDLVVAASEEQRAEFYQKFLAGIDDEVKHTISYELNGGKFEVGAPEEFIEGVGVNLVEPVRSGYTFLGWFDNADFAGEAIVAISAEETEDVMLYAKWELEAPGVEYAIHYDLDGGQFDVQIDLGEQEPLKQINIINYISYQSITGADVALLVKGVTSSIPRWWAFVAMKHVEANVYQIVKMANGSTKLPDDWDVAIAWHGGCTDADMKALLDSMLNNAASYEGKYILLSELPEEATKECQITALVYETAQVTTNEVKSYITGQITQLPVPTKEGMEFAGYLVEEAHVILFIDENIRGELNLKALWNEPHVGPTLSSITYELNEGQFEEEVSQLYTEGEEFVLPIPVRDGFTFKGWFKSAEFEGEALEKISAEETGDIVLYAKWEQIVVEQKPFMIGENGYDTLAEALDAAQDGDVILVSEGTFTLEAALQISKSITIQGKSMDDTVFSTGGNSINLAANVTFKDMTFDGSAGVEPTLFYNLAGMSHAEFENVRGTRYNSFFRVNAAGGDSVKFVGCEFDHIGQFLIWNYADSTVQTVEFISGRIDLASCGTVENKAASLFRMRAGSLYVYDSFFEGNLPSTTGGLFENGNGVGEVIIAFNTFKNATKLDRNYNDTYKVQFNKNLYLDADGNVLAGMPAAEIKLSTIVDEVVAASEEERAQFYADFLNGPVLTHTISYVLNEGQFEAEAPVEFVEGEGVALVEPVREGYKFLGWFDNADFVGEAIVTISISVTEDVILYAKWEQDLVETKPVMIGNKGYDNLAAALKAAQDGDVLVLAAGNFTLEERLTKSLSFVGAGKEETLVTVTKDVAYLDGANTSFEKLSLIGPSAGYTSGKLFYTTATTQSLSFNECILMNVNTFLYVEAGNNLEISVTNCHIEGMSQFFIWTLASASVSKITFTGNELLGQSCGATPNGNAALIRVRSTNTLVEVYNNYFFGTPQNDNDGFFENGASTNTFLVKFNTFENCDLIVHNNGGNPIVFDKNLYIKNGQILEAAPDVINKAGVQADSVVASSEEERAQFYEEFASGTAYSISYDLDGGEWEGAQGTTKFYKLEDIVLGTPKKDGFTFLGWFEEGVKVEEFELRDYQLVAHWLAAGLYVGTGENATYATIAEALAVAKANETIYVYDGTYSDALTIAVDGITIKAIQLNDDVRNNGAVITGAITVNANDLTLEGLAFTAGAKITVNNKARFHFINNFVHDTNENTTAYAEGSSTNFGFIKLIGGNSERSATFNEDHIIRGNVFDKVLDSCVFIIHGVNFQVDHNEFIDYKYDGVRVDGANAYGQFIFTNNVFKQTTPGGVTGIYFRSYSNYYNYDDPQIILIAGNRFENLGFSEASSTFKGAVATRNFQEHGVEIMIHHNEFVDCYRYLRIRNQADEMSCFDYYPYTLTVEYNNFIGVPTDWYFYNRNASDSGSNNPSLAVFGPNFYADSEGNKLETLDTSKFGGTKTTVFEQLNERVDITGVNDFISYNVTYETSGVEVDLPTVVARGASVDLPVLEKAETFFIGWYLTPDYSDDPITKLENIKANITVYARFDVFEYQNINYELNGGALVENAPTQYAEGVGVTLLGATRENAIFKGWYDNADFNGEAITKISKDQRGEVTLYALWQVEGSFDVVYHLNGGNTRYATRAEMVNDFIADFSAGIKKASLGKFFDESYGAVYADVEQWFTVTQADKWGWLWNYFLELENKGYVAPDFASDVAKVRGNLHNFLNGNASCQYGIDFTEFELAQGFWGLIQDDANLTAQSEILDAYYPYHTFLGWYSNPEFTGASVKTLTENCELYAKWVETEYTLTYVINNADNTIVMPNGNELKFTAASHFQLEEPTFNPTLWSFIGWFVDEELTRSISEINTYTMENVTVYGKWVEKTGYTINYELNGGLYDEPSDALYNQIIADFKADYAIYCSSSFSVWNGENATATAQLIEVFTKTNHKWDWLLDYWMDNNPYTYSGTKNADAFAQLKSKGSIPNGYFLWTELNGWYSGSQKSVYSGSLKSCDYANPKVKNNIWAYYAQTQNKQVLNVKPGDALVTPHKYLYNFEGWYLNPEFTGDPVTNIQATHVDEMGQVTFYAKWVEGTPVTAIEVTNAPQQMNQYDELQLTWNIIPSDANFPGVFFASSDSSIVSVSELGYLVAHKQGHVVITLTSESSSGASTQFEIDVVVPGHWDVSYETNSYVELDQQIQLNAVYTAQDGSKPAISWESMNPTVASVENGVVTGLTSGVASIRAIVSDTVYIDFVVTVLPEGALSEALQAVLEGHNSNAFTRYNLNIGGSYDYDVIGSVNDMLFNHIYTIDRQFEAVQANVSTNHGGTKSSTEFITVHYTGNMAKGATAKANADYFAGGGGGTSIHYVTGNDGIYHVLDDSLVGFHAGDGTGVTFEWIPVGVMWEEGDPLYPEWGISSDSYFTINGKKTTYHVPEGSTTATKCVTDSRWINDMGLAYKVVDGQYYMGTTWWCYTQIAEGRICNKGGNNNSIGIESAVNEGTDLWYTWQLTAQLVAHLMIQENLDITRVVGHHFYSAKNCPQPLLENDLEIWWEFIDMVELEYKLLTELSNYYIEMQPVGKQPAMDSNGRLTMQEDAQIVTYSVTVVDTTTGAPEEITLATAVNGIYSR